MMSIRHSNVNTPLTFGAALQVFERLSNGYQTSATTLAQVNQFLLTVNPTVNGTPQNTRPLPSAIDPLVLENEI